MPDFDRIKTSHADRRGEEGGGKAYKVYVEIIAGATWNCKIAFPPYRYQASTEAISRIPICAIKNRSAPLAKN